MNRAPLDDTNNMSGGTSAAEVAPASNGFASPLSASALRALLLQPSLFFARRTNLRKRPEVTFVAWIAGIAYCIDRVDTNLMKSELGGRSDRLLEAVTGSWWGFWAFVILTGALNGWILWYLAGWWYRKRLTWSGALSPDHELARSVWAYQNLVWALPSIALVLAYTLLFRDYAEAWGADEYWSLLVLPFLFWSCFTSYVGARTAFALARRGAMFWFLVLPVAFYTLGVLGVLFAFFGNDPT